MIKNIKKQSFTAMIWNLAVQRRHSTDCIKCHEHLSANLFETGTASTIPLCIPSDSEWCVFLQRMTGDKNKSKRTCLCLGRRKWQQMTYTGGQCSHRR